MRLLAGIALGDHADATVDQAAQWATRLGGTVDLLYVDETPDAAVFVGDPNVRTIVIAERTKLLEAHAAKTRALLDRIPEAHRGTATAIPGVPADVILERAGDYDAVLVATHGRTGFAHLWLGSVAEKVVRFATIPVIVLRVPADG